MNCTNCGAAMDLLSDRGYFYCRYCGSFHFPESAESEGAVITGPAGQPAACPFCARDLSAAVLEGFQVRACAQCRGMLMPRGTFGRVVEARRARESRTVVPGPMKPFDAPRRLTCPSCGGAMFTHPYVRAGQRHHRHVRALRPAVARSRRADPHRPGAGTGPIVVGDSSPAGAGERNQPEHQCRQRAHRRPHRDRAERAGDQTPTGSSIALSAAGSARRLSSSGRPDIRRRSSVRNATGSSRRARTTRKRRASRTGDTTASSDSVPDSVRVARTAVSASPMSNPPAGNSGCPSLVLTGDVSLPPFHSSGADRHGSAA